MLWNVFISSMKRFHQIVHYKQQREIILFHKKGWDKTADFENETEPSIFKMRQNRRFWKGDKTADFRLGQNRRF